MIFTTLTGLVDYTNIHPMCAAVLEFLEAHPIHTLPEGKTTIDGDKAFIMVSSCSPKTKEEALLETHKKYLDIQILIEGQETMGWAPTSSMQQIETPYNEDKDIAFYLDKTTHYVHLTPGMAVVFLPADAHAPAICEQPIRKAVIKVLV